MSNPPVSLTPAQLLVEKASLLASIEEALLEGHEILSYEDGFSFHVDASSPNLAVVYKANTRGDVVRVSGPHPVRSRELTRIILGTVDLRLAITALEEVEKRLRVAIGDLASKVKEGAVGGET